MAEEKRPVRGQHTRTDLARLDDFFMPWQPDRWGTSRPVFSPTLARLSAELAANTYHLSLSRWLAAGWNDCTLQVENRVLGGIGGWFGQGGSPFKALRSEWTLTRARTMIHPMANPVSDVVRAVRQFMVTDTGKAVVMAHPTPDGRVIIAICFMGTSRKFYDWFTNFKLSNREGLHEGFLHLARQFDGNAERIVFPETRAQLGTDVLTLADVLAEAQRPDSRFLLWLTGHSQGGAVCQTYAHLLLQEHGVLPENIVGYTMAAPTVAGLTWEGDPAAYPLYHVVNADDYVPRIGASVRLGQDMVFYPDDDFRAAFYGLDIEDPDRVYARERLRRLMMPLQDTQSMLDLLLALCRAMEDTARHGDAATVFAGLHVTLRTLRPALNTLGIKIEDLLRPLTGQLTGVYREVVGVNPDAAHIDALAARIADYLDELGAATFSACLNELIMAPHHIDTSAAPGALPPYIAIVRRYSNQLIPAVWAIGGASRLLTWEGEQVLPAPEKLLPEEQTPLLLEAPPPESPAPPLLDRLGRLLRWKKQYNKWY